MRALPRALMGVAALSCAIGTATAQQEYPSRPMRFIVGNAPGGSTSFVARLGREAEVVHAHRVVVGGEDQQRRRGEWRRRGRGPRIGLSSVEAPRGESHHFVVTGESNRPRRWRVRAPTYQNLQGVPAMIRDQYLADMTISLASIDPCFSCTDRLETVDLRSRSVRVWSHQELVEMARSIGQR